MESTVNTAEPQTGQTQAIVSLDRGVWFQSAVSGLFYQEREAAGDISAIRVDGEWFRPSPRIAPPADEQFWLDEEDMPECLECWDSGEVPTMDYESYFGAMMKPCPRCHGKLEGLGHGPLSG